MIKWCITSNNPKNLSNYLILNISDVFIIFLGHTINKLNYIIIHT